MAKTKHSRASNNDLPPLPPDGGWGWMIVVASFFSNLVVDGCLYTYGIFYVELLDTFNAGSSKTALIGCLLGGCYLMVGPLVSGLVNKFGCRSVAIFGGLFSCASFVISTFSTSIDMLLVTYGIMGGLGFGFLYLPSIVMVGLYFDTKRAMATGIAVCGSGIGTFIFAPLYNALNEKYGWRGANLIVAGLVLNGCVCGALYRPLTIRKKRQIVKNVDSTAVEELERPMNRQDVLFSGSVTNLTKFKESENMETYVRSTTSIPRGDRSSESSDGRCYAPIKSILRQMFDVSLLKSPTFWVVCASGAFAFFGYFAPFVLIAAFAQTHGVPQARASLLVSVIGLSNTIGRLIAGWLADRPWADSLIIHNVSIIIAGVATCFIPILTNIWLLFAYAIVFGLCIAAFIALRSIVLVDLLGVEKLTNAFGLVALAQGIAITAGTPVLGIIVDSTGSYKIPFIISGVIVILSGVVCLPARAISRMENARTAKKNRELNGNDYTLAPISGSSSRPCHNVQA